MRKFTKLLCAATLIGAAFSAAAWEPSGDVKVIVAYKAGNYG